MRDRLMVCLCAAQAALGVWLALQLRAEVVHAAALRRDEALVVSELRRSRAMEREWERGLSRIALPVPLLRGERVPTRARAELRASGGSKVVVVTVSADCAASLRDLEWLSSLPDSVRGRIWVVSLSSRERSDSVLGRFSDRFANLVTADGGTLFDLLPRAVTPAYARVSGTVLERYRVGALQHADVAERSLFLLHPPSVDARAVARIAAVR